MFSSLKNMFKIPDLRGKIVFTVFGIALFRLGSHIPTPGIDFEAVQALTEASRRGGVLGFLNLFSGGALTRFAVFGLGVMPYITAQIIMQLLQVVIPKLEEWRNQGAAGQKKINQAARYLTVALAVMQSTGLAFAFNSGAAGFLGPGAEDIDLFKNFNVPTVMLAVLSMTAGTAMVMWLGETITQRGIGQGPSILIFANVVSELPTGGARVKAEAGDFLFGVIMVLVLAILVAIVFVEQGQRRIPVQFAKRVVGRRMYGGSSTYIPLKVNQAGVIPIIFASSVLYIPQLLQNVIQNRGIQDFIERNLLQSSSLTYMVIYGTLVVFFAYFYTAIAFNPTDVADNMKKYGGFVPGIRPGRQTAEYLDRIMTRITLPGALFIAAIALLPDIVRAWQNIQAFSFGGTSILITVGVTLETMKQIESQLTMRHYEGFLK